MAELGGCRGEGIGAVAGEASRLWTGGAIPFMAMGRGMRMRSARGCARDEDR